MISTGITGTARHGTSPNSASSDAGEDIAAPRAAARQDRRARARHMRRIDRVAGRLQREIGLDRGAEIEGAAVEQRPAAMRRPGWRADSARCAASSSGVDRVEIMLQQDIFGRDRRVGLELERPNGRPRAAATAAIRPRARSRHRAAAQPRRGLGAVIGYAVIPLVMAARAGNPRSGSVSPRRRHRRRRQATPLATSAAAARPERIAPSIVAGKPVST